MSKASEIEIGQNVSLLLKGSYGFGKTLAASSFCLAGPIWIAYFDKKKPIELVHFYKNIIKRPELLDYIEYEIYGANNANEYLNKLIDFSKHGCRYSAVITDSVTNLTSAAVNWSLGFRKSSKGDSNKERILPDFDEYKIETSLVTQALDICRTLSTNVIWTAHPVPSIKIEGSGNTMKIIKTNPIVTYGSKVAGIVPGNFSEQYHFLKRSDWDANTGKSSIRYLVSTEAVGDEYAKSNLGLKEELDITDRLFYEVWQEALSRLNKQSQKEERKEEEKDDVISPSFNPFSKQSQWKT